MKAVAATRPAHRLEPEHSMHWLRLGNVHLKLGDVDKAIECFTKAQRAQSEHHDLGWRDVEMLADKTALARVAIRESHERARVLRRSVGGKDIVVEGADMGGTIKEGEEEPSRGSAASKSPADGPAEASEASPSMYSPSGTDDAAAAAGGDQAQDEGEAPPPPGITLRRKPKNAISSSGGGEAPPRFRTDSFSHCL